MATQVTESDYRIAQQGDARVRQEFLDAIDLEDAKEFIGKVDYFPGGDQDGTFMDSAPDFYFLPMLF